MTGVLRGKRVVIAGGSGFLGSSLARHCVRGGADVTVLTRRARNGDDASRRGEADVRFVAWDARSVGGWSAALDGADALVNLAGRTVDCIKTPDHCDEVLRSRVEATRVLGEACAAVRSPPRAWVQMGTAHIYGDPPEARCDESSPTGWGLAPHVGREWEAAFERAEPAASRGVVLRTSFVLGTDGRGRPAGALTKLAMLCRMGLGGRVGSGRQGLSWLHEADMNAIFERAMTDGSMSGVYVASSPNPVGQVEFMRALRRVAGGMGGMGIGLPAPEALVRIGARLVLRTDPELALYGRYVLPARLMKEGFVFAFPTIEAAVAELFGRGRAQ